MLLDRMVANLVDNAVRHNHAGARGTIDVRTWSTMEAAHLAVENTCPPLPAADADRLFEPFFRVAATGPSTDPPNDTDTDTDTGDGQGTGLGLAIVRAIAERHGGTVEALPTAGALEVHVTLPRSPA